MNEDRLIMSRTEL